MHNLALISHNAIVTIKAEEVSVIDTSNINSDFKIKLLLQVRQNSKQIGEDGTKNRYIKKSEILYHMYLISR